MIGVRPVPVTVPGVGGVVVLSGSVTVTGPVPSLVKSSTSLAPPARRSPGGSQWRPKAQVGGRDVEHVVAGQPIEHDVGGPRRDHRNAVVQEEPAPVAQAENVVARRAVVDHGVGTADAGDDQLAARRSRGSRSPTAPEGTPPATLLVMSMWPASPAAPGVISSVLAPGCVVTVKMSPPSGGTQAVDHQVLDAAEIDRRQRHSHRRSLRDRHAAAPQGRGWTVADRVGARRAVDDQRVAGGRVVAVDGDARQAGWNGRVVQVDLITARLAVDGQGDLVGELDRLLIADRDQTVGSAAHPACS